MLKNLMVTLFFFFSSRRRHTRFDCDWSSDVCSSDLLVISDADHQVAAGLDAYLVRAFENKLDPTGVGARCQLKVVFQAAVPAVPHERSEERRVGKECRSRWSPYH